MQRVTSITSQPKQRFVLKLETNETVSVNFYYYASQQSWYYDFQYKDYISNGNKVVLSMNALHHLRKILPFGIGFISTSNADPFELEAFVNGKCNMILLNQEDIQAIEEFVYNAD